MGIKLRNKETGETGYLELEKGDDEKYAGLRVYKNDFMYKRYDSLAGVLEEWEDYKPAEPLIKDEKIRKAVRAWAEALGLQEVYCASNGYEVYGGIDDWVIQFEGEPFPFADRNKIYTIAELCGEEEE